MSIQLPPLPEPEALGMDFERGWDGVPAYGYTADQYRAGQREAALAALEEAVKVCLALGSGGFAYAAAIRALRTELEKQ